MAPNLTPNVEKNTTFLLLDRDGVINEERPSYVLDWSEFVFKIDFLDNVSVCSKNFDKILVVTNQSCVGRGLLSQEKLDTIHKKMIEAVQDAGAQIDKVYYSSGFDESDPERKPGTGMIGLIQADYPEFRSHEAYMVGNRITDMEFAKKSLMTSIHYTNNNVEDEVGFDLVDWRLDSWSGFEELVSKLKLLERVV